MLYGSPLTLPGELAGTSEATAAELVERIRNGAEPLPPLPTKLPEAAGPFSAPEVLQRATHVYILRGALFPPWPPDIKGRI
jgi:hypothetical protein